MLGVQALILKMCSIVPEKHSCDEIRMCLLVYLAKGGPSNRITMKIIYCSLYSEVSRRINHKGISLVYQRVIWVLLRVVYTLH